MSIARELTFGSRTVYGHWLIVRPSPPKGEVPEDAMKTLVNTSVFGLIPVPAAPDIDPVRVEEDKALTSDDQHHADKLARLRRALGLGRHVGDSLHRVKSTDHQP
jgi:hypothetical protein